MSLNNKIVNVLTTAKVTFRFNPAKIFVLLK